ncbi:MAG TPA: (deoxy)nucleoside triphosphate pyrophosphohydrolase [Candidatus Eisenbacteria bacterium]|jgi:8-oxo-dGTP diphosphatase|nr:(deoxy)nucleoside triphosphate pyrophosphohydrolase [Candidatus Eisenbacteria bacterium]
MLVVAAVIERADRRILIGQRRKSDTSPLKWEFPGGKVWDDEAPEAALARELREELGATLRRCVEIARVTHRYAETLSPLEIRFFAAKIAETEIAPTAFEQVAWVLPKELSAYDFLAANGRIVADLATGRIKPSEVLQMAGS